MKNYSINNLYFIAKQILLEIGEIKICDCANYYYRVYKYQEGEMIDIATKMLVEKIGEQNSYNDFYLCIHKILAEVGKSSDCLYCKVFRNIL